jgi:SAM-dependent methyltransferase
MANPGDSKGNLYTTDEYIVKNPSLHEEDSPWKVTKIAPLVDGFVASLGNVPKSINLLDVGGGAGLILAAVSSYIEERHGIAVHKYALDLMPGALEIQKRRNPDLKKALNEDIRVTSLGDKEIDLTLLIDLIEHVPNPALALKEISRISKYAIFKVPLDDNIIGRMWNVIRQGEPRRQAIQSVGHINVYNWSGLLAQVSTHTGHILHSELANVHEYTANSEYYRHTQSRKAKLLAAAGRLAFRLSPRLSAFLFNDFAMLLVRCR